MGVPCRALAVAALLLIAGVVLAVIVYAHPAPLPGDVGAEVALQHLLLPHRLVAGLIEGVSTINFPIPSAIAVATIMAALLIVRRWLDVLTTLVVTGLADGSSSLVKTLVRRPRPAGHGIYILQHLPNSFSYPSGHVIHATAVFGILVYLTYQARRPRPWLLAARVVLLLLIVLMGPSRMLEGEHWLSDVVGGLLYGAFWLIAGIGVYNSARRRFPRLSAYIEPSAA